MDAATFKKKIRQLGYMSDGEINDYIKRNKGKDFGEEDILIARNILSFGYVRHRGLPLVKNGFTSKRWGDTMEYWWFWRIICFGKQFIKPRVLSTKISIYNGVCFVLGKKILKKIFSLGLFLLISPLLFQIINVKSQTELLNLEERRAYPLTGIFEGKRIQNESINNLFIDVKNNEDVQDELLVELIDYFESAEKTEIEIELMDVYKYYIKVYILEDAPSMISVNGYAIIDKEGYKTGPLINSNIDTYTSKSIFGSSEYLNEYYLFGRTKDKSYYFCLKDIKSGLYIDYVYIGETKGEDIIDLHRKYELL